MTAEFGVDLAHLDAVTARIGGLAGFAEDTFAGVNRRVDALHRTWTGDAAAKHAEAHRDWAEGAADVRDGIAAMRAAAVAAHTAYSDAITVNVQILES
ncbi:WXG100 family type VII secretion target [Nocardia sp. NBC_00508]|uniref:WXG100 family type VII secretion target n=1 Tax=Nocardia sp. NBC_00508 TaxID=2975992 RepID=UPI002E7FFAD3|nr:WXG100 family type VII secretion target [Nocardia sp. NBC_00508]WUD64353.1 WXG100 family type VII secretion target [Nocardia sp. NBC_00508]